MDALEFNAAAEASLPEGIASVLYLVLFVFVVLVATFALLLMIVLFPIAITWCIFLGLPMELRVIFICLIFRRMMVAHGL
jgi:hypothetical protein